MFCLFSILGVASKILVGRGTPRRQSLLGLQPDEVSCHEAVTSQ